MKRTQIYLEVDQHRRLSERAERSGRTVSDLIREAISRFLAGEPGLTSEIARYRRVLEETAGVASYLPSGKEYTEALRRADRARLRRFLGPDER